MTPVLINPKLLINKNDKFTTGIVYMPISLAYINSIFLNKKIKTHISDLFGAKPNKIKKNNNFLELGEDINDEAKNFPKGRKIFFIFANQIINHNNIIENIRFIKKKFFQSKIVVVENSQALTAYSVRKLTDLFFNEGVNYLVFGEPEYPCLEIYNSIIENRSVNSEFNIIQKSPIYEFKKSKYNYNLDLLYFPNWDGFNLNNYWGLGHAHGPLSSAKYLPILTSRGCPYPCKFCVIPETSSRIWRARTPKNIVDEIIFLKKKYGVDEFHIEDLNPTVNESRTIDFCNELVLNNLDIKWKIVSGTKVESIKKISTIELMAKSGCKYISISPESGSSKLMKLINKPFDINHAIKIIKSMNRFKIFSQACFVLGFPEETSQDRKLTLKMIKKLVRNGLDEIALFIVTPIPGSAIFDNFKGYKSLSELNFSPKWRDDYIMLNKFRIQCYIYFLIWKFLYHPKKIFKQIKNFITCNFETKMEMVPYKAIKLYFYEFKA